ncbi:MAG: right-handed parallel beta-helix repeat-containing protein, partial [Actinobacteria bacterium]|nr:right-handed parallel beta-helix repeat-containing protein [Actinomycetota bacterium]
PAEAAHIGCGTVITQSTTLHSDIGPCPGDGLVVTGSNIVLDLGTRRVFAANGPGDNAGIRLANVSGVTVTNGTVEGFDAGIVIVGGSGNVVTRTIVQNNINDFRGPPCDLGDGIIMNNSDNNRIESNVVRHNGPYGGITALGDADGNQIRGNSITDHNIEVPDVPAPGTGCGNSRQDEGVRIEGPGANNNMVTRNSVERSLLAGIGLHGYVCQGTGAEPANSHTSIVNNVVRSTSGTSIASGINILEQGPIGQITCAASDNTLVGNVSTLNEEHGIFVATTSQRNTINTNVVDQNGVDGIYLSGPTSFNTFTNIGPTLLDLVSPDRPPYTQGTDFRVMSGSGSGDVTARLVAVDIALPATPLPNNTNPVDTSTSGCEMSDFTAAGFQPGDVALLQRGTCTFVTKVN